ncbi:hypothetical protein BB560_002819 [Smittium megazygosporum]|uniref:Glycogen [starch] synthase n=1 Tax=Smittium megazygosporum TaxID=133381 RepID=A0A2T9ZDU4_9FUNG|nr:hypothetical protein BB560_002819 [Smittium megazygosporum]
MKDIRDSLLFEFSWEVVNKVGGIFTVIKTKAPVTSQEYGNRYYMVGPYNHSQASIEVEEADPITPSVNQAISAMRDEGVHVITGKWLIEGSPQVILFDTNCKVAKERLNEWKADLWKKASIPSPSDDGEMDAAIQFGYLANWFITSLNTFCPSPIIAHFHEWQTGVCPVLLNRAKVEVATIFTTHATLLGRYLCAGDTDFYNNIKYFDVDAEAGKRGIYHKYCVERAAAHSAKVFTTVSNITAYEAEHLLKRKPDGILPNGLNVKKFSATHEFQNLHQESKMKINEFVRGHFYGHMDSRFNLDDTLYLFTAGRYEYRNKGIDLFIESLSRLNNKLKMSNSPMTVVAFIIAPAKVNSYTVETLKGQAVIKQLRDSVNYISSNISNNLFESACRQIVADPASLISPENKILLKKRVLALKRDTLPPIVTHNMQDDFNDPTLNQLRRLHMFNNDDDRVKVVFHPQFLNANNPVLGLDYEEFVRGTHLGVFPSYYEPWGYTPSECTVLGIPSVTTNLSGFGCYMEDTIVRPEDYGIYIIDRRLKSVDESINQLADCMFTFCRKTRRQRINQRNRTERLGDILDWKRLGIEYVKARHFALSRAYPESMAILEIPENLDQSLNSDGKISRPMSAPGTPPPNKIDNNATSNAHENDPNNDPSSEHFYSNLLAGLTMNLELPGVKIQDDEDDDLRPPINLKMKTPSRSPSGYSSVE